jgi:hypothetical protein
MERWSEREGEMEIFTLSLCLLAHRSPVLLLSRSRISHSPFPTPDSTDLRARDDGYIFV